jgi:hypothetical protein
VGIIYETRNIENHLELYVENNIKSADLAPFTANLVQLMALKIGVREITEENAPEVLFRIREYEKIHGATFCTQDGPHRHTAEDITRHIGLRVNARPMTPKQFDTALIRSWRQEEPGLRRKVAQEFFALKVAAG